MSITVEEARVMIEIVHIGWTFEMDSWGKAAERLRRAGLIEAGESLHGIAMMNGLKRLVPTAAGREFVEKMLASVSLPEPRARIEVAEPVDYGQQTRYRVLEPGVFTPEDLQAALRKAKEARNIVNGQPA